MICYQVNLLRPALRRGLLFFRHKSFANYNLQDLIILCSQMRDFI